MCFIVLWGAFLERLYRQVMLVGLGLYMLGMEAAKGDEE